VSAWYANPSGACRTQAVLKHSNAPINNALAAVDDSYRGAAKVSTKPAMS